MNDLFPYICMVAIAFIPIFTQWIEKRYDYKIKKLDLVFNKKMPVYLAFANSYGKLYKHVGKSYKQDFVMAAWSASLLSDSESQSKILQLLKCYEGSDEILNNDSTNISNDVTSEKTDAIFAECMKLLHDDLSNHKC